MTTHASLEQPTDETPFYLLVGTVFFAVIALLMFLFAATFVRDMQTLRAVPDALWNFLCGTPTDNLIALPLLLTIGIACVMIGIGLQVWRWWITREDAQ